MANNTKSPLKDKPLRNPGQSIDEYINSSIMEQINTYIIFLAVSIVFAAFEWWRSIFSLPISPWAFTIVAMFFFPFLIYRLIQLRKKLNRHRMARDGEMEVGQYLEHLREKGYTIFHDIVGDRFNIDHVVISEHGIYVVETKTYSKPAKGAAEIFFDGESIRIDKGIDASGLIIQAKSQKSWLQDTLKDSTGKNFDVLPVIVFPGWYINSTKTAFNNNLWVLNPKALPAFIENKPKSLSLEDCKLVTFHLSRFIRST